MARDCTEPPPAAPRGNGRFRPYYRGGYPHRGERDFRPRDSFRDPRPREQHNDQHRPRVTFNEREVPSRQSDRRTDREFQVESIDTEGWSIENTQVEFHVEYDTSSRAEPTVEAVALYGVILDSDSDDEPPSLEHTDSESSDSESMGSLEESDSDDCSSVNSDLPSLLSDGDSDEEPTYTLEDANEDMIRPLTGDKYIYANKWIIIGDHPNINVIAAAQLVEIDYTGIEELFREMPEESTQIESLTEQLDVLQLSVNNDALSRNPPTESDLQPQLEAEATIAPILTADMTQGFWHQPIEHEVPVIIGNQQINLHLNQLELESVLREVNTILDNRHTPSVISCNINDQSFKALIDTGATVSIVSLTTIQTLGLTGAILECTQGPVRVANNSSMQVLGTVELRMKIGPAVIKFQPLVVRDLSREIIIGKDVLRTTRAKLDMGASTIMFQGCPPLPFGEALPEVATVEIEHEVCEVWAAEEVHIPPRKTVVIPVQSAMRAKNRDTILMVQHPSVDSAEDFQVWDCLVSGDQLGIAIANCVNRPIVIHRGTKLGLAEVCNQVEPEALECTREIDITAKARAFGEHKEFQPSDINLGANLSASEKAEVHTLLHEFRDVFTENLEVPGQLKVPPFTIDLVPEAKLKPQPAYRKPETVHLQISTQTTEKVAKGVAEPSESPCPAQVIMVPKKDGKLRQCVDLRYINSLTVPMILEMPRIDDMFATLRGSKYISLGDATWGYWQLKLKEEDRYKAAYATREGNFQPTVMDFGMRNAPAYWQRTMNRIFQGLLWKKCLIYIDDLLIFSKTFHEHMGNMRECLQRCRDYNLKLRPSKCSFFQDKLPFLGHMVSGNGLEMDDKKVEVLTKTAPPINASRLNSFVCFAQYYRDFIKNFADIVRPLRDLILAPRYEWLDRHQRAFDELKSAIAQKVVLAHPFPNHPFTLECDASNYGISFILSQADEKKKLRPIAFGSRSLTGAEQNYSATERECLAVVEGVRKYHVYLYGTKFKVITDHKALQWLFKHKDPSSKLMRWAIRLQGYQFEIEHRPGVKHANADALSRLVESTPRDRAMPKEPPMVNNESGNNNSTLPSAEAITGLEEESIAKAQWNDVDLKPIIQYLRDKKLPSDNTKASRIVKEAQHMELYKNVLYHIWWPENKRYWEATRRQVAIPHSWRARILQECHDSPLSGGHLGFTKTHNKMRDRYWWPGMYSESRDYVLGCIMCQKRKGNQPNRAGEPQAIVTEEPWSTVGMDVFGPLKPKTANGNKYILTFTDFTSKYVIACALRAAGEEECADALIKEVICRHGVMKALVSDRGANFVSHMMNEVYKLLKIHKINTTAWHPQGNGITERFNKPLADMLAIYIAELKRDWDEVLPYVILAYNAATHETTKFTPYFLLFGKEPRFPFEIALTPTSEVVGGIAAYAEEMVQRLKEAVRLAKDNIQLAQHKAEAQAAAKRTPVTYQVGQKVWLYVKPRTKIDGMSAKLQLPWQGPFTVLKQITPNVVSLRGLQAKVAQNVHVNRLKSYREDRPTEEPVLTEDDEFDPTEENAISNETAKEGEPVPEEEAVLDEITAYKINTEGELLFSALWASGEREWVPEVNVEHSLALERYFHSKRTEPFFAIRLYLEKFQKLFKRKAYSPKAAVEQLCQCFTEFCVADPFLDSLLSTVRKLETMEQVRDFVWDQLHDIRAATKSLTRKPPSDLLQTNLLPNNNNNNKHTMSLRRIYTNSIDVEEQPDAPKRQKCVESIHEAYVIDIIPTTKAITGVERIYPASITVASDEAKQGTLDARFTKLQEHLSDTESVYTDYDDDEEMEQSEEEDDDSAQARDIARYLDWKIGKSWEAPSHAEKWDQYFAQQERIVTEGNIVDNPQVDITYRTIGTVPSPEPQPEPDSFTVSQAEFQEVERQANYDWLFDRVIKQMFVRCTECDRRTDRVETEVTRTARSNYCEKCCIKIADRRVIEIAVELATKVSDDPKWRPLVFLLSRLGLYRRVREAYLDRELYTNEWERHRHQINQEHNRIEAWPYIREWCRKKQYNGTLCELNPVLWVLWNKGIAKYLDTKDQNECEYCQTRTLGETVKLSAPHQGEPRIEIVICKKCTGPLKFAVEKLGLWVGERNDPEGDVNFEWRRYRPLYLNGLYQQCLHQAAATRAREKEYVVECDALAKAVMKLKVPPVEVISYAGRIDPLQYMTPFQLADLKSGPVVGDVHKCQHCPTVYAVYQFAAETYEHSSHYGYCGSCAWGLAMASRVDEAIRASSKKSSLRMAVRWYYKQAKLYPLLLQAAFFDAPEVYARLLYHDRIQNQTQTTAIIKTACLDEIGKEMERVMRTKRPHEYLDEEGREAPLITFKQFAHALDDRTFQCSVCNMISWEHLGAKMGVTWWGDTKEFAWVCKECRITLRVVGQSYLHRPLYRIRGIHTVMDMVNQGAYDYDLIKKDYLVYARQRDAMIFKDKNPGGVSPADILG